MPSDQKSYWKVSVVEAFSGLEFRCPILLCCPAGKDIMTEAHAYVKDWRDFEDEVTKNPATQAWEGPSGVSVTVAHPIAIPQELFENAQAAGLLHTHELE